MELRRYSRNSRLGLTLIELVLVLGILAVLAAMTFPRYSSQKASLESVSKEALSLFQLAQQEANASYSERRVSFNRSLLAVNQVLMEDLNGDVISVDIPNADFSANLDIGLDAIIFSPTQNVLGFLGLSKVSLSNPVTLTFTSSSTLSRNITIYPNSRRVHFY